MVGSEFVTWLLHNIKGVDSREDACIFGNELFTKGLFQHATKTHRLLDGFFFYQLKDEYCSSQTKNDTPKNDKKIWKLGKTFDIFILFFYYFFSFLFFSFINFFFFRFQCK